MTADLVQFLQFLRARLDEDAAVARAAIHAGARAWRVSGTYGDDGGTYWSVAAPVSGPSGVVELVGSGMSGGGAHTVEVADHIARHDPARVLAEVDAKRQIVELHGPLKVEGDPFTGCTTCSWRDEMDELWVRWPCPTLRLLVLPYSSHPDYRPEWAPDPV